MIDFFAELVLVCTPNLSSFAVFFHSFGVTIPCPFTFFIALNRCWLDIQRNLKIARFYDPYEHVKTWFHPFSPVFHPTKNGVFCWYYLHRTPAVGSRLCACASLHRDGFGGVLRFKSCKRTREFSASTYR